ncbi:alpha/beta fold hydrolase [Lysinibacter sp. HNR]|uniref:alpha/beta hydrolase n=1 Tax=Lysinibacter sp. HNR TaxID=3031408 RepID=UPI00243573EA|nr:alpha/beta fold hydrolase [Lysinibacter sp. HNR]WGD38432.1 alpha/beta fold hydrolase [Lysinibacter sp. HNR]
MAEAVEIRSGTVLDAHRTDIDLHTRDGLTLVGELALPRERQPQATLVTLHPLPTAGGFMDSHIYKKASFRLPALADIAVLRFNTRGTVSPRGTSEGAFGEGVTEQHDVEAAMAFVEDHELPKPWIIGWSFGTELALKYAQNYPIEGAILLSPPLHRTTESEVMAWAQDTRPIVALIPEFDDYLRPEEAAQRFSVAPNIRVVPIEGGRHLWVGETQTRRVLNEIVGLVNPSAAPLPHTVDPALVVTPNHNMR